MARQLHHRKKDNKYALYSTVTDDYVSERQDKEIIRELWLKDMIWDAIEKVNRYMEEIDEEI